MNLQKKSIKASLAISISYTVTLVIAVSCLGLEPGDLLSVTSC